jgi:hypothetical protein
MQNQQQERQEQRMEQLRSSRWWSASDAQYVLDALAASGEPLARFARRMKIGPERLRWWSKRLSPNAAKRHGASESKRFVPMVVKSEAGEGVSQQPTAAVLVIANARVELSELSEASAAWSARLLESLRASSPADREQR